MGELVPLRPQPQNGVAVVTPLPDMCEGVLHIFDSVPGICRCGEETWLPEGRLAEPPNLQGPHAAIGIREAQ